jgi:hypothetical protein
MRRNQHKAGDSTRRRMQPALKAEPGTADDLSFGPVSAPNSVAMIAHLSASLLARTQARTTTSESSWSDDQRSRGREAHVGVPVEVAR